MSHRLGLTVLLAALAASVATPASAATNLSAFWHLDESTGATAVDSSGNGNNGAVSGATPITGRFSRALKFDGIDDKVVVPRSASMEPPNVTVEGWVRSSGSPGTDRYIISQGASQCEVAAYGLYTGAGGGLMFYISDGVNFTASPAAAAAGVWDGGWHHVAGTFDGATVRLFVDGEEVGVGSPTALTISYAQISTTDGFLGTYGGGCADSHFYAGDLDEPRTWRRALTSTEIAASAAMGADAGATTLDERIDTAQALVYTSHFSDGTNMTISTQSSTATAEKITSIKLLGLVPLTTRASCRTGLLNSLLNSSCDYSTTNGGRTAKLTVRPLLGHPTATLRVTVTSGRTFDVTVST